MSRFRVVKTAFEQDFEPREETVIVDRPSFKKCKAHFGMCTTQEGFIRCRGKRYIGSGGNTGFYVGSEDEIYYAGVHCFDGMWIRNGPDAHGIHHYVTENSGTGRLFRQLEKFCHENGIEAV